VKNFLRRTLAEVLSEDPDINPGHSYEDDTGYTYDDDQLSTGGVEDIADEAETEFLRWAGVKEDDPEGEDLLWDIWEAVPGRDIASDILNRVPWSSAFISAIFLRAGIEFFSTAQHKQYMIKALENRETGNGSFIALRPEEVVDEPGLVYVRDRGSGSTFENPGEKNHADISLGDGTAVGGNLSNSVSRVNVETDENDSPVAVQGEKIIMVIAPTGDWVDEFEFLSETVGQGPSIGTGKRAARSSVSGFGRSSQSAGVFTGSEVEKSPGVPSCWNKLGDIVKSGCNFDSFIVGGTINFRSAKPGKKSPGRVASREVLEHLRDKWGVKRIIDLTGDEKEKALAEDLGLGYITAKNVAKNYSRPESGEWETMKSFMDEGGTLVHCTYGADRTGAVVARYKIENGERVDIARKEAVDKYGMNALPDNKRLHAWLDTPVVNAESINMLKELIRESVGSDIDIASAPTWSSWMGSRGSSRSSSSYSTIGSDISGSASDIASEYGILPEEAQELVAIGKRLQTNPGWLAKVINAESGWKPDIPNARGSGAMGLIQFMPSTARGLGTTTQELSQMTIMEQLPWVEKYFSKFIGKLNSLEDVAASVFFPAALHKGMNFDIYEWYVQNRGQKAADIFKKQNPGTVTMGDYVRKHLS
tara:strand:+ start:390 stop:2330 length:1941 start_codon:yes stop_codon:yes gene_type:complete